MTGTLGLASRYWTALALIQSVKVGRKFGTPETPQRKTPDGHHVTHRKLIGDNGPITLLGSLEGFAFLGFSGSGRRKPNHFLHLP